MYTDFWPTLYVYKQCCTELRFPVRNICLVRRSSLSFSKFRIILQSDLIINSGKEIENVTKSINNMCSAAEQCQIYDLIELEADYNVADGCNYERLNITFGCMYDSLIKLARYKDRYSSRDDESTVHTNHR